MTEMAKWEFYDEHDEVEGDEQEPSFSIYDFRKWLENQGGSPSFDDDKKKEVLKETNDSLKEEFKKRVINKVDKNIERRMSKKKRK